MPEKIVMLLISDISDYEEQPFKVREDEEMDALVESVKTFGVLNPAIVRPHRNGRYEMISGHRRKRASELAGKTHIPSIIRNLSDDEAAIALVDSNLQRENISPSERAFAYKLKYDAQKRQGERTDLTSGHDVPKWEDFDKSDRQVRRYIRLTELVTPLLDKVDDKSIPVSAGTELSFLNVKAQSQVNDYLERELCTISEGQAVKIRKKGEAGELTETILSEILREKEDNENFSIDTKRLRSYFPKNFTSAQCRKILWEILDEWFKGKNFEHKNTKKI